MKQTSEGFTLVEVLVVTALVLILSVVTIPMLETTDQRQKEERFREVLPELRSALEAFHQDFDRYPASLGVLITTPRPVRRGSTQVSGFYLRRLPLNPLTASYTWQIASRTSDTPANDVWWPPLILSQTPSWQAIALDTTISNAAPAVAAPIVDIRCPPGVGVALNNLPYERW
ncbi:MAG: prepilin-type N-terminal cleavage/methylation domain-containing protein [Candidatus Ozemobacteraceae bacterium]